MPVAKSIYFCDDIVPDVAKNKLMIVGMFNAVRVPPEASFPYTLEKLCVFAQLIGGVGQVPVRLDVVRAATNQVIHSTGPLMLPFPTRLMAVTLSLRLQQFSFPAPGGYLVEFFCQDQFVDDRLLRVLE